MMTRKARLHHLLAVATAVAAMAAASAGSSPALASSQVRDHVSGRDDPYAPSYGHSYRHGAVPTRETNTKMKAWQHANLAATGPQTLSYGGGVDGIGVTSGKPKVYLVFWGSQWGSSNTDGNGNLAFSTDTVGGAGKIQQMFKGLGTGSELWSGVMTQYCDGAGVAAGDTTCAASAAHVGYPTGGALAGVWYDDGSAEPTAASPAQLASEAVRASGHFGNTTAASNRYAQYVILSPKGLNPDHYRTGGFCAWHDWNGDLGVASSNGDIAFTNMPYVMDAGASCGANFVNGGAGGATDGYTMVEGHEYSETITDQNPAGGWTNHGTGTFAGQENADECAWLSPGVAGGAGNVSMATGSFAEQSTWSNDTNNCALSHPIVGGDTGNSVTVTRPGTQTARVGTAKTLQVNASDSASGQTLTYSATGLPNGLTISSSTGLVSGTPTTGGYFHPTVTATDTTGAHGSATFTWLISGGAGCTGQLFGNRGFETGTAAPWAASAGVIDSSSAEPARTGTWKAWLDGRGVATTETLAQPVSIHSHCVVTLRFYLHIDTAEPTTTTAFDTLKVKAGATVLKTYSNLNRNTGYALRTLDVSRFAGQTLTFTFAGTEDASLQTSFVIDDTALTLS